MLRWSTKVALVAVAVVLLAGSTAMAGWGRPVVVVGAGPVVAYPAPVVAYAPPVVAYPYRVGYVAPVVVPAPVVVAPVGRVGYYGQFYPYAQPVRNTLRAALPPY